jgi:hypothetical protein
LSLDEFHQWLKIAVQKGAEALASGGRRYLKDPSPNFAPDPSHQLRLVIANNDFFGVRNLALLYRSRYFFIRKKMCSPEQPTALILTAFTPPGFDVGLAEARIINNIIFKPFDKLILKQHLEYALTGHQPLTSTTISARKLKSRIEVVKRISLESVSELGFTTFNDHTIAVGAISKYYSDLFNASDKRSLLARCTSSREVSPGEFFCEFTFVGDDNAQISSLRREIFKNKEHKNIEFQNPESDNPLRVLILDKDEHFFQDLKEHLTQKIRNSEFYFYPRHCGDGQ